MRLGQRRPADERPYGPLKTRAEAERLLAAQLVRPTACRDSPGFVGLFHFAALLAPKSNVILSLRGARQRSMAFPPGSLPSVAPITSSIAVSAALRAPVVFAVGCCSVASRNTFQSSGDMLGSGNRGG
jgi:hypothetical protein